MKTTKAHFRIFVQECKRWIDILGLYGWKVYYTRSDDLGKVYASITTRVTERVATIAFPTDWDDAICPLNETEIKLTAKHEVLHLLLARLLGNAISRYVTEAEMMEAEEEVVVRLMSLIRG